MEYRQACPSDFEEVKKILESNDLPAIDCEEHFHNFVVAEIDKTIVGIGGFENCGNTALLRSFAVVSDYRDQGVAGKIFDLVKANAKNSDITRLYLLTTTANEYFERLGFSICDRKAVPDSIRATKQFNVLCPATADVMTLELNR